MPSHPRRNTLYLLYFFLHIPTMLLIDLTTLYPAQPVSAPLLALLTTHYKDQFFAAPPPRFFVAFMWMEVFFHLPVCLWGIGAVWRGTGGGGGGGTVSPSFPVVMLAYGVQTFVTTATCVWEMGGWDVLTREEKGRLVGLYSPYLVISLLMCIDMGSRLRSAMAAQARAEGAQESIEGKKVQ